MGLGLSFTRVTDNLESMNLDRFADAVYCANPLATREIQRTVRGKRFFFLLTGIALTGSVAALFVFMSAAAGSSGSGSVQELGSGLFRFYVFFLFASTILITPALAAGSICTERSNGSLDFLRVTDLSDTQVFLAKLSAPLYLAILVIMASFPVMMGSQLLGGFSLQEVVGTSVIILTTGLAAGCTGLLVSALVARLDLAVILTYAAVIGYLFISWGLLQSLSFSLDREYLLEVLSVINPAYALRQTLTPGDPPVIVWRDFEYPLWTVTSLHLLLVSFLLFLLGIWQLHKEPLMLLRYTRFGRRRNRKPGTQGLLGRKLNPIFVRDFQCGFLSGSWIRLIFMGLLLASAPCYLAWQFWPEAPLVFGSFYLLLSIPIVVGLGATAITTLRERGLITQVVLANMEAKQILIGKGGSCVLVAMPFLFGSAFCLLWHFLNQPDFEGVIAWREALELDAVAVVSVLFSAVLILFNIAAFITATGGFLGFWIALALSRSIREPTAGRAITSTVVVGLFYSIVGFIVAGCLFGALTVTTNIGRGQAFGLAFGLPFVQLIWVLPWLWLGERHLSDTARMLNRMVERYDYASTS